MDNLITSLTSNAMIAPGYWVDPKSGNNYFVTVQYPENQVHSIEDLKAMPLRGLDLKLPTYLNQVADVSVDPVPHGSGPLSIATIHRHLRGSVRRRSGKAGRGDFENHCRHEACRRTFASTCAAWS